MLYDRFHPHATFALPSVKSLLNINTFISAGELQDGTSRRDPLHFTMLRQYQSGEVSEKLFAIECQLEIERLFHVSGFIARGYLRS